MKKVLLVAVLLAGSISFSNAQQYQQRSAEERAKMQSERISERLKLTPEQKTKAEAIFLSQAKSIDSLRAAAGQGADRQAMFSKMAPIREQADKQLTAILTEDQKKAFSSYQDEMRNRTDQRGQRGPRPNNK